jgi:hypothetical protein
MFEAPPEVKAILREQARLDEVFSAPTFDETTITQLMQTTPSVGVSVYGKEVCALHRILCFRRLSDRCFLRQRFGLSGRVRVVAPTLSHPCAIAWECSAWGRDLSRRSGVCTKSTRLSLNARRLSRARLHWPQTCRPLRHSDDRPPRPKPCVLRLCDRPHCLEADGRVHRWLSSDARVF